MTNPIAPVYLNPGEFPKLLYRSDSVFVDEEALKQGLSPGGAIKSRTVTDEADQTAAIEEGWTDSPLDFIGTAAAPRARKAKAADA